jgi:hypothetical protein
MEGTLLVLRTDLVVFAPAARIPIEAAIHLRDRFEEATDRTVRIVVIPMPVQILDMRDADPELEALAERIAGRLAEAVPA